MKTIPEVRSELAEIAKLDIVPSSISRKLKYLINQMYRRPYVRKAAKESAVLTPQLRRKITRFAYKHPGASYKSIANVHNVCTSSVSMVLAGTRKAA